MNVIRSSMYMSCPVRPNTRTLVPFVRSKERTGSCTYTDTTTYAYIVLPYTDTDTDTDTEHVPGSNCGCTVAHVLSSTDGASHPSWSRTPYPDSLSSRLGIKAFVYSYANIPFPAQKHGSPQIVLGEDTFVPNVVQLSFVHPLASQIALARAERSRPLTLFYSAVTALPKSCPHRIQKAFQN